MRIERIDAVFDLEKGTLQSTKCELGDFDFITASRDWKSHKSFAHEKEALVIAVAASGSLGRTHYVDGKFIASDLCFILTPKREYVGKISLPFYQFVFNGLKEDIVKQCATGTAKQAINQKNFSSYRIPVFEPAEQARMALRLSAAFTSQESLDNEITHQQSLLEKLKQAILLDAIQGKLTADWRAAHPEVQPASQLLNRIQAEKARLIAAKKLRPEKPLPKIMPAEIPFEIPKGWEWCRFGSYARFERGKFSARPRNDKRFFGGPYPFIQIGSLDSHGSIVTAASQTLNDAGLAVSKMFEAGTIAVAIVGGTIGNLGVLGRDMCFTDSVVGVRPSKLTCQDFILLLMRSKQPEIQSVAYQRAGQPNISLPNLTDILIPLPPVAEQAAIVERVEVLMATCRAMEAEIEHSRTHAAQLLQAVLKEAFAPANEHTATT